MKQFFTWKSLSFRNNLYNLCLLQKVFKISSAISPCYGTLQLRWNNFRFSHSSIKPNGFKYSFSMTFCSMTLWTFSSSSIFPAVEVLCKLLAYFLIQSFRIVLSWILLYQIWNYRLYIWRITKSFHQNNTVEANTLNIIWLQKIL